MKKTLIAAIASLAIFVPAQLRADETAKEYNMVITLQNGTTITLGHNDIKNITFNGEEISISGDVVNTIEEINERSMIALDRAEMLEAHMQEVFSLLDKHDVEISSLNAQTEDLRNRTEEYFVVLSQEVHDLRDRINYLEASGEASKENVDELRQYAAYLQAMIDEVKSQLGL